MPEEIRIPKQKRSIEKKEALKKAAVELFSTKGFHKQMCRSAHFTVILLIRSRYMRN